VTADLFIADAHNDLLMELVVRRHEDNPFGKHWLPPLRAGGVRLQVVPIYSDPVAPRAEALRRAIGQAAAFQRALRENAETVVGIGSAREVAALAGAERVGLMLSVEGAEPWESDDDLADDFWDLGVRMAGLTWNYRNAFADGVAEPASGGLSARGVRLVERLVARGVILDLAHASERTFRDVLDVSGDAPVLVSHAACRACCDTPRNLDDTQLEALAERGGVLGIMLLPFVIDTENPTLERVVDHIDHAVAVMGIEHVALGGDFFRQTGRAGVSGPVGGDGIIPVDMLDDDAVDGLAGPEDYPNLVEVLRRRGYEGERLAAILGVNLGGFLERSLPG
jgi:membrane dipeptidase